MTKSDIILNVEDGSIISELTSTLTAPAQSFVFGDILDLQITGVAPNEGSDSADKPWKPIDMAGKEFRVAIGTQDRLPFAGSFTINSSAQIAYNATGTTVETALNADATIASEGGVSVSALSQGGWRVTYNTTGAKTAIAGNENSLLPSAQIYADILRAGDGSTKEAWMIRVETSPSAYAELTDDIAQPTITATQVRNGNDATGISEVQSFAIVGTPTSGTFALVLDSVATGEIAYDADSISITEAIENHPLITGEDLVSVIGTAKDFTVTFDSSLGDLSAMSVDASNLVGLNGTSGQFSLNTNEIVELLNGAGTSSALFEIVLFDTDNSRGKTVHQSQVTINQDVIPDTPPSVTPIKQYADIIHTHAISGVTGLQAELDAKAASVHTHVISDVTGLQTDLDDLESRTTSLESPPTLFTHGIEDHNSTDASFSPSVGVRTKVLNNGLGAFTNLSYKVAGRDSIWDATTSEFDFAGAGLVLGDTVTIRLDFTLTTTSSNDGFKVELDLGAGAGLYTLTLSDQYYRFSGTNNFTVISEIYMGDANTLDNPATIYITPDASGSTINYNGHYVKYSLMTPSAT